MFVDSSVFGDQWIEVQGSLGDNDSVKWISRPAETFSCFNHCCEGFGANGKADCIIEMAQNLTWRMLDLPNLIKELKLQTYYWRNGAIILSPQKSPSLFSQ